MASFTFKVPKLIGSKWLYEYPVWAEPQRQKKSDQDERITRKFPEDLTIESEKSAEKSKDWRGPWPRDAFGLKPRLIGGKLIKPKLIDY